MAIEKPPMCQACGMVMESQTQYHPFAACLMMRGAGSGRSVDANLRFVVAYGMRAQRAGVSLDDALADIAAVTRAESQGVQLIGTGHPGGASERSGPEDR